MPRNGVTQETFSSMLIGPGAIYKGFISPASPGTLIGATLGGNEIEIARTYHAPQLDGMLGPVKGTERIIAESATITAKIAEINKETLMLALSGTTASDYGSPATHSVINSNGQISAGNYQDIAIVGDMSNMDNPIIFVAKNSISTDPVQINLGTGKDDIAFQVKFTAHYDQANPTLAPYDLYTPKD